MQQDCLPQPLPVNRKEYLPILKQFVLEFSAQLEHKFNQDHAIAELLEERATMYDKVLLACWDITQCLSLIHI